MDAIETEAVAEESAYDFDYEVETWDIGRPIPYDNNPRLISDEAIDKVAASIGAFGWQFPIVVDRNEVIIAGHTSTPCRKS